MNEIRRPKIGDHVVFVDQKREARDALVIHVWEAQGPAADGVNLVTVDKNEGARDSNGRQTEKHTSVCHESVQPAGGYHWRWPEEG